MKFLIVRFSSIGDIVLTFPVVEAIKAKYPHAQIHYITKKENATLLRACLEVDKVILIENKVFEVLAELKSEKYDVVIDLHKNLRSQTLKNFLRVKSFTFPKLNIRKWIYVRFKWNVLNDIHVVERYFQALKKLGIKYNKNELNFHVPKEFELTLNQFGLAAKTYHCIVLGAKYQTKKLPLSKLLHVIENFDQDLVLLGGKEEEEIAHRIIETYPHKKIVNFVGILNILESAYVLKNTKSVLTNDTGLMHIAASFDCKILLTWGNTTRKLGMYPYGNKGSKIVEFEVKNLSCRPCSKIGFSKCPKEHFNCMSLQNEKEILREFMLD